MALRIPTLTTVGLTLPRIDIPWTPFAHGGISGTGGHARSCLLERPFQYRFFKSNIIILLQFARPHQRSCTPLLRIIPLAQKPGTMPLLTTLWRGSCHGLASFLLPTCSVGDPMALRHVASPWVHAKPARLTCADQAQAQAFDRAQSVRGPDPQASLCVV